jgi:Fe-S-cluster containining protein
MKFECQKCCHCCETYFIKVFPEDKERWKDKPNILRYFSQDHCPPCEFLEDNECLIYDIRPIACRDFPFHEKGYKSTCIGIKHGNN